MESDKSKGEVLVFQRGNAWVKKSTQVIGPGLDEESSIHGTPNDGPIRSSQPHDDSVQEGKKDIFHWRGLTYDITIKGEDRRILDSVDGWVKPGTLTALMVCFRLSLKNDCVLANMNTQGATGAGKTTLLDVLASRVTTGVVRGDISVSGLPRPDSFQRKTGYVQQQDIHLPTSTVREALRFSAVLRQPSTVSMAKKLAYVEEVIELLGMEAYSDAIVGVPGQGQSGYYLFLLQLY